MGGAEEITAHGISTFVSNVERTGQNEIFVAQDGDITGDPGLHFGDVFLGIGGQRNDRGIRFSELHELGDAVGSPAAPVENEGGLFVFAESFRKARNFGYGELKTGGDFWCFAVFRVAKHPPGDETGEPHRPDKTGDGESAAILPDQTGKTDDGEKRDEKMRPGGRLE